MERWYQEMTAKGEFSYETSLHLLKAQTLHGNIERGWDVAKETPRTINEAIEMSMHLYGYAGDVEGAIQQLRKLDDRALYIPALLDSIIDIENIEGTKTEPKLGFVGGRQFLKRRLSVRLKGPCSLWTL